MGTALKLAHIRTQNQADHAQETARERPFPSTRRSRRQFADWRGVEARSDMLARWD